MHFVEQAVNDLAVRTYLVVTGLLAAGMTHTAHGGPQSGSCTTHIQADLIQIIKCGLHIIRRATLEHDVPGLTVEGYQA